MSVVCYRGLALHCIPKNANSAMKVAVLTAMGDPDPMDKPHKNPRLHIVKPGNVEGYKAAFVRDPVSRVLSCYADKSARDKGTGTASLLRHGSRWVGMTLEEFVETLPELRDKDVHTKAQYRFLSPDMDFIGRIETLSADWSRLQDKFTWLPELRHINATDTPVISVALLERIKDIYREDYERIEVLADDTNC